MSLPSGERREGDQGQALVLFVILLVMLLTTLALVVNGGTLRRSNQELWNALDAGALAAAASLPGYPDQAATDAARFAGLNLPDLTAGKITVTFQCLVGDRDGNGSPDSADIPATCNPGSGASWTCADGKCFAPCDPNIAGRVCNTVVVTGTVDTDFRLSGVTKVDGATTTYTAAACSGLCGSNPQVPLDLGIILDRTGSMSDADLANVKSAALGMLETLDPSLQSVGMAVLGQSQTSANCSGTGHPRGLAATGSQKGTWVVVPYPTNQSLSTNYLKKGSLNANSQLVRTIECLDHSSTGTNLGDPLLAMAQILVDRGRSGVPKGIILMTDGAANQPNTRSCKYANDQATKVKNMGIEVYTIGFGVVGDRCTDLDGPYQNAYASSLLADMATQPTVDNGCTNAENADGDFYFCEPRSDSLASVFKAAAAALVQGSARLVSIP